MGVAKCAIDQHLGANFACKSVPLRRQMYRNFFTSGSRRRLQPDQLRARSPGGTHLVDLRRVHHRVFQLPLEKKLLWLGSGRNPHKQLIGHDDVRARVRAVCNNRVAARPHARRERERRLATFTSCASASL